MERISNIKDKAVILQFIQTKLQEVIPMGGRVLLFGSQARGDTHSQSDWDILILINKKRIEHEDFNEVAYPLIELGWELGATINPLIYTYSDWEKRNFTPFYKNVEQDGIEIWH